MTSSMSLRRTFDRESLLYNKIRPRYPDELFKVLIRKAKLQPEARLLEIGPGTGQATIPLAEKGYWITAIELGEKLAEVARHELRTYPGVDIITDAFEDVVLPKHHFDLVYAATALHWVKPEVRYDKPHSLLKPGGHLAVIHTHHVSDQQGDRFFHASQAIYDRYYRAGEKPVLPKASDLTPSELDERLFRHRYFEGFPVVIRYTALEYAELLTTYSPTLALPPKKRKDFLGDVEALITEQFAGSIEKHFVMSLTIAQKIVR